jgi:hypothetical protein
MKKIYHISVRLDRIEYWDLKQQALDHGYTNVSEYVRLVLLEARKKNP